MSSPRSIGLTGAQTKSQVANVIRSFPDGKRAEAQENIAYLDALSKGIDP